SLTWVSAAAWRTASWSLSPQGRRPRVMTSSTVSAQALWTFDELTVSFRAYLQQICRKERTIYRYTQLWARIKIFMDTRRLEFYNKQVGEAYLDYLFGGTDYLKLTRYHQVIWNSVEALAEFQDTGTVIMGKRRNPPIEI